MKRTKNFFDVENEEEIEEKNTYTEKTEEKDTEPDIETEKAIKLKKKPKNKQIVGFLLCLVVVVSAVIGTRYLYNSDEVKESDYFPSEWLDQSKPTGKPKLKIYPADWETDILSDPKYLEIKSEIIYSPNGATSVAVPEKDYKKYGKGFSYMAEYVKNVINGDYEKLNGMFSDEYNKKNKPYEAFPKQRLFDVKITKYLYHDPAFDKLSSNDEYYIITYKIDRNDGLFRDDIDEESELAQLFELIIHSDGRVEIDNVISLPGYNF